MSPDWVLDFDASSAEGASTLGGKGAGLASMTSAGLPVPPGFTITTRACRAYYESDGTIPDGLWEQVDAAIARLEARTEKDFGGGETPLLVSVRSGAPVSMPGMMDTVLNLGLSAATAVALGRQTGDEAFAMESHRRFVQMYGEIVLGISNERLRVPDDLSEADALRRLTQIIRDRTGSPVPDEPTEQLRSAIASVFDSWMNRRAIDYRNLNGIPHDLYTAVNVQSMVFGNTGPTSGTGVLFTRNPTTGEPVMYGEYLQNAQGEDVVAGLRTPEPVAALAESHPAIHDQLIAVARQLEQTHRDVQDIEFTVEREKLYLLQTRNAKRTGRAAIRTAVDMVDEGIIDRDEAVGRVSPNRLDELLHPVVQAEPGTVKLVSGLAASPGGASGIVSFDADEAVALTEAGHDVILVRHETSPDDFHGMVAAKAVVTSRGGVTSHAAVVARGMGKCCVVGCSEMFVDYVKQLFVTDTTSVLAGDVITVDGTAGIIYAGHVPMVEPELDHYYDTLMGWVDDIRRLDIRANADTGGDAETARRLGAEGIGLCRTEHMFFAGDRIDAMRRMIMAPNEVARTAALAELEPFQTEDFEALFEAMAGHPVTIRLLDPPLHEFLPSATETTTALLDLKLRLRTATGLTGEAGIDAMLDEIGQLQATLSQVDRLSEANPMLGHRGCRLGVTYPEITRMQSRAIFTAARRGADRGIDARPEIMVPLVAFSSELENQRAIIDEVARDVLGPDPGIEYRVGTMIELPRAALTADEICRVAEFVSFGTNDLTQTTLGLSRDDSSRFLPGYVRKGITEFDPFQHLDERGVGELVATGVERSRSANGEVKIGVCGEHGGDPQSIAFLGNLAIDYVSCSPYRVPIARLSAAHAELARR
ncbi:MAG: pyruvate, phosphate dikinase [Actinomycetota bacterium]